MSSGIFLLWLLIIPLTINANNVIPISKDYLINCGSNDAVEEGLLKYVKDDTFISTGNKTILNKPDILPRLQTLRFFPNTNASKYCYNFPVIKQAKYLVRTVYYYGGFDGREVPPVFDQIIDSTTFGIVNTTEDYVNGGSSYYEAVVVARNKFLSVCMARNQYTAMDSHPFITSIEVHQLNDSVYSSTNFKEDMLVTVSRTIFGLKEGIISFPDDDFNRYWQPFNGNYQIETSKSNVTTSTFWNIPPQQAFTSAITVNGKESLMLDWPQFPLSTAHYYLALYFHDTRDPSPSSWRVFDVEVNGGKFYQNINVTVTGQAIVGTWPLRGETRITLVPKVDSIIGPMISAGEVLQMVPLAGKTIARDHVALEEFSRELDKVPEDWIGDPCLPRGHAWTGVSCSKKIPCRIVALNLTGFGLSGTMDPSIARLTGLRHLILRNNKLTGQLPDLGALKSLETLHLENNQFEGSIPSTLGDLPRLREVFLENNKLDGKIPELLAKKEGITIRV